MKTNLEFLRELGEDYFAGLTNKGTVKRAAKDIEKIEIVWEEKEEENGAVLHLEDVTCHIVSPLGDSTCSCPSRSICRHIILCAMYLKDLMGGPEPVNDAAAVSASGKYETDTDALKENVMEVEGAGRHTEEDNIKESKSEAEIEISPENSKENNIENKKEKKIEYNKEKNKEIIAEGKNVMPAETAIHDSREQQADLFPQIKKYPYRTLVKMLGEKKYAQISERLKDGIFPRITETSIVTVEFVQDGITVKLLEPVEFSACTCHKKDICIHKAEAILSYQVFNGSLSLEEMEEEYPLLDTVDYQEIHKLGKQFQAFLEECLEVGLARTSPSTPETLERLAVSAHNAGLADFERRFRELGEEYKGYLNRMAAFRGERLAVHLAEAYFAALELETVETGDALAKLAGEFKSAYFDTETLTLAGMGCRSFQSNSGYEGFVVYLMNIENGDWYTYTKARPTFYEGGGKPGRQDNNGWGAAPWGMECTLEELSEKEFCLYRPKVNKEHRISSSGKSRGEVLGRTDIYRYDLSGCWYEEFHKILDSCFEAGDRGELGRLVFVKAERMEASFYDEINQAYRLPLYDKKNRKLELAVHFSKEEKQVIRALERLEKRAAKKQEFIVPVFLGIVFIEDAKLSMYPVAIYEQEGGNGAV